MPYVEANPDTEDTLDSQADPGDNGDEPGPSSEVMEVTPGPPVYIEGKGWVWAKNLAVGDVLLDEGRNRVQIRPQKSGVLLSGLSAVKFR